MERDSNEKTAAIVNALKEYFECPDDDIPLFVVACERTAPDGTVSMSSAWSLIPTWHLTGFVDEIKNHIEQERNRAAIEQMMTGSEEKTE